MPTMTCRFGRSGLLIAVDGGAKYQFTHLTLQEFFAAQALEDDTDKLLDLFRADNDTWREVIRLWCGIAEDSTRLIHEVTTIDPILAFECLGDAKYVQNTYADELIRPFMDHIEDANKYDAFARALALVAAHPGERGSTLFRFLEDSLDDSGKRLPAAAVMSLTNLPKAAEALVGRAEKIKDLRQYLVRMGDLAVDALVSKTDLQRQWMLDALHKIGTPLAATTLANLLWAKDKAIATRAAWLLSMLLYKPNVEENLSQMRLESIHEAEPEMGWVWEPFNEEPDSAMPVIAGRIVHVLKNSTAKQLPEKTDSDTSLLLAPNLDPRIVIPLLVQGGYKQEVTQYLLDGLAPRIRDELLKLMNPVRSKLQPTVEDWRNIRKPSEYEFGKSWESRVVKGLLAVLCVLNLYKVLNSLYNTYQFSISPYNISQLPSWTAGLSLLWGVILILLLLGFALQRLDELAANAIAKFVGPGIALLGCITGFYVISKTNTFVGPIIGAIVMGIVVVLVILPSLLFVFLRFGTKDSLAGGLFVAMSSFFVVILGYLATLQLYFWWEWRGTILFWMVWLICMTITVGHSIFRQRRARNPLRGLLSDMD